MVLMVYFFLFTEEVVFHDDWALHFTVEFQAWDFEVTCSPASYKPSIQHSHRMEGASQSEWPVQKEVLKWIDPLRVISRPPWEFSWLFIVTCQAQSGNLVLDSPKYNFYEANLHGKTGLVLSQQLMLTKQIKFWIANSSQWGLNPCLQNNWWAIDWHDSMILATTAGFKSVIYI